jgi:integrase
MPIVINSRSDPLRTPWNKGRLVGQKRPLRPKEVWAIRVRLQIKHNKRDLAMFNLAIDSKLRGCDLVSLRVDDIAVGGHVRDRATIVQHKTGRPVQFEITEQTRASLEDWLSTRSADRGPYVFPSRVQDQPHVTARQYARIVHSWIEGAGMDSSAYGTHSLRRTKAAQIYRSQTIELSKAAWLARWGASSPWLCRRVLTRVRPLSVCEKWREFPIGGGDFLCRHGNRRSSADARVPARQHRPGIETQTV